MSLGDVGLRSREVGQCWVTFGVIRGCFTRLLGLVYVGETEKFWTWTWLDEDG